MGRQMKPSNVVWAAQVPAGWSIRRVKEICTYVSGDTPDTGKSEFYTDISNGYPWMTIRDLGQKVVMSSKNHLSDAGVQSKKMILQPPGTLMMSFKLSVGVTSIAGVACYTNEAVASFKGLYNPYWYYALGPMVSYNAKENIYGSPLLNKSLILNAPVVVPPLKEQKSIAAFLDDRTSVIDRKIQLLEEKTMALADLRKSVIHQAVTKGLDSNAAMKPSGVDWIGDMPAHWELVRHKEMADFQNGYAFAPSDWGYTGKPIIRIKHLNGGCLDNFYDGKLSSKYHVEDGDFLYAWSGTIDIFQWHGPSAYLNQHIFKVSPKIHGAFYFWQANAFNSALYELAHGSTMKHVQFGPFKNFVGIKPPHDEQVLIAQHLQERTFVIDESIKTITAKIEALKSLRQSLIHEAVTGKIDVAEHGYHYA